MAADKTEEPEGGYEVELVNEAPCGVDVFCPVCTLVLRSPMQFKCCTRHLCEPCYIKSAQHSTICPVCGAEAAEAFQDGAWARVTQGLRVYCRNKQRGCYWENELRNLSDHLETCPCEMITCPRACGFTLERRYEDFHVGKICRFRSFSCEYCSLTKTYDYIAETHYDQCQEYPLKCLNKCKDKMIKRKDMKSHIDVCPLEEVTCVFAEVGCGLKCKREDMGDHMQSSMQDHLMMTMETVRHLKLRVKTLEEKQ